ncbi:MAG: TIM barrel protein [Phycisphaerae bacterium]|jgi:hydroxypyruvate isomerase|nr:TIM barrel protein [Phycisphaerae bacterium]
MELGLCVEMALSGFPFEDRLRIAGRVGFKNVEMWFVDMSYKGTPENLARLAERNGVRITNTVIGAPDGSVGGGLTNPANRDQWLKRARMTIDFTKEAQIPATIVCTGNEVDGLTGRQMTQSVLDGLKRTVDLAEKAGITLLLEPLNTTCDHAGYWLVSSDRGADICRQIGSERMRLLFDCYHMQIMEGDLVKHIERNMDVIGHIHAAGVPGRNELDNSEVNYRFLVRQIEKMGYRGIFALEYQPSLDDETSLVKTLEHLG